MKKSELINIIKPIIEECVQKEVQKMLLQSNLLSHLVKESLNGVQSVMIAETQQNSPPSFQQIPRSRTNHRESFEDLSVLNNRLKINEALNQEMVARRSNVSSAPSGVSHEEMRKVDSIQNPVYKYTEGVSLDELAPFLQGNMSRWIKK